ncbi:CBU_0592 family membrane protein [Sphingomonas jatrophae]|uniref:CBU-0592-like domain-containing protein n=1 Tax=Sphingomonas jatrophae TaxID=1166337 RepID=A0A1I6KY69_9SPHN|nr:hypothetical protein [Sphingomonas jatrophae]SFR95958.1 hypothetical protein SAMN05192580_1891 [Sphingomonas jatrophae]
MSLSLPFATCVAVVGWAAAGMILLSYVLLTLGRVTARSASYQWLNLVGAAGFVLNSGYNGAMPSAALNVLWAGFALFGLWRIAVDRRTPSQELQPRWAPERGPRLAGSPDEGESK